jgi:hypothetical protein
MTPEIKLRRAMAYGLAVLFRPSRRRKTWRAGSRAAGSLGRTKLASIAAAAAHR